MEQVSFEKLSWGETLTRPVLEHLGKDMERLAHTQIF